MTVMKIPGRPERSLEVGALSAEQARSQLVANVGLFASRRQAWKDALMSVEVGLFSGHRVKMHVAAGDPDATHKKEQLKAALALIKGLPGLALPEEIEVFIHHCAQPCLGYLAPLTSTTVRALLILGNGVTQTRTTLVSTLVRDEAGGADSVPARQKQILTAIVHELGHVLHQISSLPRYSALGDLMLLKSKAESELTGEYAGRLLRSFPRRPSAADMDAFVKATLALASQVSQYAASHPNEFVAETFSGLVMGYRYSDEVMAAYHALGGPAVTPGPTTRTRRRADAIVAPAPPVLVAEVGEGL